MEQRSEAYKNYVADSLFFLQHLYTNEEDENHGTMFGLKLREVLSQYDEGKEQPKQDVEEVKNRMIEKSKILSGTKQ